MDELAIPTDAVLPADEKKPMEFSPGHAAMFSKFDESLTEWHLDLLQVLADKNGRRTTAGTLELGKGLLPHTSSFMQTVRYLSIKLKDEPQDFIEALIIQLYSAGLITVRSVMDSMPNRVITGMGSLYLQYRFSVTYIQPTNRGAFVNTGRSSNG